MNVLFREFGTWACFPFGRIRNDPVSILPHVIHVVLLSSDFKMAWIYAAWGISIRTVMQHVQPIRNWADIEDVADAVGRARSAMRPAPSHPSVTVRSLGAGPNPAAFRFKNVFQESLLSCGRKSLRGEVGRRNFWRHIKRFIFELSAPAPPQRTGASFFSPRSKGVK